jgi:hypothetical protein
MKKQLYRAAAATVLGLSLTTGVVAADNSGSIGTTGPNSSNKISATTDTKTTVKNNNDLGLTNSNWQTASTGSASAHYNTTAGDVTSGDATNDNSASVGATIDNSGSSAMTSTTGTDSNAPSSIDGLTGPGSNNSVVTKTTNTTTVTNNNDVDVKNSNNQSAKSGSATVSDNTTGGNATSGNASNTNASDFTFSISN